MTKGLSTTAAPRKGHGFAIFRGKALTSQTRVYGYLSEAGALAFDAARANLRRLYREIMGHQPSRLSDGDTVEYLVRGETNTRAYLERLRDQA